MMAWEILPAAQNELQAGFRHYDEIDQRVADDFYSNFILLRDQARAAPKMYRIRRDEVRRVNLGPQFQEWYFAFLVIKDQFVVIAVAHAKRKPHYFSERVRKAKRLF